MKTELQKQVEKVKRDCFNKVAEIKEKIARAADIPDIEKEIAEALHSKLCRSNHDDACDWFYDDGSWRSWARVEYLKKAREVLKAGPTEVVRNIIRAL